MTRATAPALLRRIEAMGVEGTEQHWKLIPPAVARRLKPQIIRVGDGLVTLLAKSDALRLNRVIGLGHRGEADESMVDGIIGHYRAAKVKRFSVLLGPGPQSAEIERWLIRRGLVRHGGYALHVRDLRTPVPSVMTKLRVARARRADDEAVVRILSESFWVPVSRKQWTLAAAAARENEILLAWAGATPVAVATVRVTDRLAWLGGASTRVRWRRQGAQGALIAARLRRATKAGCEWAWSETAPQVAGRPDGSRRNLVRMGFEQVAIKPAFVWQER